MAELVWRGRINGALVRGIQDVVVVSMDGDAGPLPPLERLVLTPMPLLAFDLYDSHGERGWCLHARKPKDRRFAGIRREGERPRLTLACADPAAQRSYWHEGSGENRVAAFDHATHEFVLRATFPNNCHYRWELFLADEVRMVGLSEMFTVVYDGPWGELAENWPSGISSDFGGYVGAAGARGLVRATSEDGALERWDYAGNREWRLEWSDVAKMVGVQVGGNPSSWRPDGWRPHALWLDRRDRTWVWEWGAGLLVLDSVGKPLFTCSPAELAGAAVGGERLPTAHFAGVDAWGVAWWTDGADCCGVRFPALDAAFDSPEYARCEAPSEHAPALGEPLG